MGLLSRAFFVTLAAAGQFKVVSAKFLSQDAATVAEPTSDSDSCMICLGNELEAGSKKKMDCCQATVHQMCADKWSKKCKDNTCGLKDMSCPHCRHETWTLPENILTLSTQIVEVLREAQGSGYSQLRCGVETIPTLEEVYKFVAVESSKEFLVVFDALLESKPDAQFWARIMYSAFLYLDDDILKERDDDRDEFLKSFLEETIELGQFPVFREFESQDSHHCRFREDREKFLQSPQDSPEPSVYGFEAEFPPNAPESYRFQINQKFMRFVFWEVMPDDHGDSALYRVNQEVLSTYNSLHKAIKVVIPPSIRELADQIFVELSKAEHLGYLQFDRVRVENIPTLKELYAFAASSGNANCLEHLHELAADESETNVWFWARVINFYVLTVPENYILNTEFRKHVLARMLRFIQAVAGAPPYEVDSGNVYEEMRMSAYIGQCVRRCVRSCHDMTMDSFERRRQAYIQNAKEEVASFDDIRDEDLTPESEIYKQDDFALRFLFWCPKPNDGGDPHIMSSNLAFRSYVQDARERFQQALQNAV